MAPWLRGAICPGAGRWGSELLRRPSSGPCRSGRCVRYTHPRRRRYCRRSSRSAQRSRRLACCGYGESIRAMGRVRRASRGDLETTLVLRNDGFIDTGPFLGHAGLRETIPEQSGILLVISRSCSTRRIWTALRRNAGVGVRGGRWHPGPGVDILPALRTGVPRW